MNRDTRSSRPYGRRWLAPYALLVYMFLYLPIIILVAFSFNKDPRNAVWQGLTLEWYVKLFHDAALMKAFGNSFRVAALSTILSTGIGTAAALALHRYRFPGRQAVSGLALLPMMVPEIVTGISLLTFFVRLGIQLSYWTIVVAHVAFSIGYVTLTVQARLAGSTLDLEEAAADLGAGPYTTFRLVTLPRMLPGVVSGALLAFTLSFDDFVITFFTAGVGAGTLPLTIYSMIKFGVTPEINAVSTLMLSFTMVLMVLWSRLEDEPGGAR